MNRELKLSIAASLTAAYFTAKLFHHQSGHPIKEEDLLKEVFFTLAKMEDGVSAIEPHAPK